jgi:hypothetical protein
MKIYCALGPLLVGPTRARLPAPEWNRGGARCGHRAAVTALNPRQAGDEVSGAGGYSKPEEYVTRLRWQGGKWLTTVVCPRRWVVGRGGHRWGFHEVVVRAVGDAGEVREVGREPKDAPAWTEVDWIGLSAMRCPAAVEQDGTWSGVGGGLALRADTKEEATLWGGGGEASQFGLLHDVSQGIRTRAAHVASGHQRCTVTIRGVARACA